MADANGEVAVRDPDTLVKEIERTRENLARTIGELTERVSPANLANQARTRVREQANQAMTRVREQVDRPEVRLAAGAVGAVIVLGLTAYLLRRRRR